MRITVLCGGPSSEREISLISGRAVADALAATGINGPAAGATAVRVVPQSDGWYRCLLDGVTTDESDRFATALDELMAPLWEPRWLLPRPVLVARADVPSALRLTALRFAGRIAPGSLMWHAVPSLLATRRDRVAAFEAAWRQWVAPGARAIPASDPQAQGVLAARRGDDPFLTETQLRTLWT